MNSYSDIIITPQIAISLQLSSGRRYKLAKFERMDHGVIFFSFNLTFFFFSAPQEVWSIMLKARCSKDHVVSWPAQVSREKKPRDGPLDTFLPSGPHTASTGTG